jgi:hypothetical protein
LDTLVLEGMNFEQMLEKLKGRSAAPLLPKVDAQTGQFVETRRRRFRNTGQWRICVDAITPAISKLPCSSLASFTPMDGKCRQVICTEGVALAGAVPTVWGDVFDYLHELRITVPSLRTALMAGRYRRTAPPVRGLRAPSYQFASDLGMTEAPQM